MATTTLDDFLKAYESCKDVVQASAMSKWELHEDYPHAGFYVYCLIDPQDNQIFYVGKGISGRALKHEEQTKRGVGKNRAKVEKLQTIYMRGQQVIRRILAVTPDEASALAIEDAVIRRLRPLGLTNIFIAKNPPKASTLKSGSAKRSITSKGSNPIANIESIKAMSHLVIETWPIDKLIPYARNPRKNDEQVDRMCGAIREFGFRIPIVAKSDGTVVDGHLRLKAAHKLGMSEVPVALADELTDTQVKAFRLLANQSANWAEWDNELLNLELEELEAADFDIEMIGFDLEELSLDPENGSAKESNESEGKEQEDKVDDGKYTSKIALPVYEPMGLDVSFETMANKAKMDELIAHIKASNVSDEEKEFLIEASHRHTVFNYQHIAEYYASKASKEMQKLMEESALVIIDLEAAIEGGYVRLTKEIEALRDIDRANGVEYKEEVEQDDEA